MKRLCTALPLEGNSPSAPAHGWQLVALALCALAGCSEAPSTERARGIEIIGDGGLAAAADLGGRTPPSSSDGASASADALVAGADAQAPGSTDSAVGGTPPGADYAGEGESCASISCDANLACVTVYSNNYATVVGKFCMERCNSPGGSDPTCDGGESCVSSKSAGNVCYNPDNATQGYTSPGDAKPLPPPPAGTCGDAYETEVFNLVNQVRANHGRKPLACDATASKVAHDYSRYMCDESFFSHTGLDGSSPFTRLKAAGATYKSAGENIAAGQKTPQKVMEGWMNSSGHRANILRSGYTHIGVGYAACGSTRWTQSFLGK